MHGYQTDRHETIRELYQLFVTVQQVGQVFADASHGAAHKDAHELNELLHLVRLKIEEIHAALPVMGHASDVDAPVIMARFTTQLAAQAARR